MKTCSRCRKDKPRDQFNKDARRKDGLFPQCKPCRKDATAAYREVNRDKLNAASRARTAANPGRSTAGVRAWRLANPEAAKALSYRYVAARRARMVAADYEPVDYAQVIAAHQNCYLCGQPLAAPIEVDHVTPLARGGAHCFSNLMPTHACCNNQKGARLLEELTEPFNGPLEGRTMTANNCTNPPHFPPHCGCPAGVAPAPQVAASAPASAPVAASFNPAFAGAVNPALALLLGGGR